MSHIDTINAKSAIADETVKLQPLLKWAGGKRALAEQILPSLAYRTGTYFEPFFGGGAIFFRLQPQVARLSDINSELIECYEAIKSAPEAIAERLTKMPNSEEEYYRIRNSVPRSAASRAARLVYLTSLSFNGIYRQNLKGKFNVPYGKKLTKNLPSISHLKKISSALAKATLSASDFEAATHTAVAGDTVYFDPPYTVAHNNNGFVKYNKSIFSWNDQVRLASHAADLAARGCTVVVSNADHYSVRELYKSFTILTISRQSVIAACSAFRRQITECLFISQPVTQPEPEKPTEQQAPIRTIRSGDNHSSLYA